MSPAVRNAKAKRKKRSRNQFARIESTARSNARSDQSRRGRALQMQQPELPDPHRQPHEQEQHRQAADDQAEPVEALVAGPAGDMLARRGARQAGAKVGVDEAPHRLEAAVLEVGQEREGDKEAAQQAAHVGQVADLAARGFGLGLGRGFEIGVKRGRLGARGGKQGRKM